MDFSISEDQQAIRDLSKQIFGDIATDENLLAFSRSDNVYHDELWSTLAEQGLLGLTIAEELGGSGFGFSELCLILEEQGRRVAPVPLFSSLVLGALPIARFGSEAQKQQWLVPLASGKVKLSAAIADLGMPAAITQTVSATQQGEQWILNGRKDCVPDGASAACILVPAVDEIGATHVFLVDTSTAGVSTKAQTTSIGDVQSTLNLHQVLLDAGTHLDHDGQAVITWLQQHADTALCAMQVGVTEEALKRTAEFTCERKQFNAPIGAFQAVAMQAADAYINVEAMRSTYWLALFKLTSKQSSAAEVSAAKYWACEGGHKVVHTTQHLHGGMGSDIDFPIHRFFLWAKHIGTMLGGSSVQIAKLGALLASDGNIGDGDIDNCKVGAAALQA
jgi:3-oxocholest-4-en-26-oyl-CoA dehydrogenase beta subunit